VKPPASQNASLDPPPLVSQRAPEARGLEVDKRRRKLKTSQSGALCVLRRRPSAENGWRCGSR